MKNLIHFCLISLFSLILFFSCGNSIPEFNGDNAYQLLVKQTDFGPRVPGTEPYRKAIDFFKEYFAARADQIILDTFSFTDTIKNITLTPLTNIIARFHPDLTNRILIGAHFDSRPMCDRDPDSTNRNTPVLGANDGASGVAVLLELAEILSRKKPSLGVDLILFDLEDWGEAEHSDYFCIGSKHYASGLNRNSYKYVIVVDMIGDKTQTIYKEGYSAYRAGSVVDLIWKIASELNIETFKPAVKFTLIDDHLSFQQIGIPAIVIIDFDYPFWHTIQDTPDKCSPESLANVGKILVALLYR
jgi:Zn-dependent M28 family amino/carboxypeptidase